MIVFGMWGLTIFLLACTYFAQGQFGVMAGSIAGIALGLSVCITFVESRSKS